MTWTRGSIGATSSARRTVDDLVAIAHERRAVTNPAVRGRLADAAISVQVLRNLAYKIASEQEKTGIAPNREAQMAKLFGAELQQRVALTAVQLFGMEGQATHAGSRCAWRRRGTRRSSRC